jgi:hypothetical protein
MFTCNPLLNVPESKPYGIPYSYTILATCLGYATQFI